MPAPRAKQISTDAYQALRSALSSIFWFKSSFETYVQTALRDVPEVIAGINFRTGPKREVVDVIVDRLMRKEMRYRDVTLRLMMEVASRSDFSELEKQEKADQLVPTARANVATLKKLVSGYEKDYLWKQQREAEEADLAQRLAAQRRFSDELEDLRVEFIAMAGYTESTPQERGIRFEKFLNRVFELFDLEPRLAYSLDREQLDGAFSFDTDDYVVEAKWRKTPISRDEADTFDAKVKRKGRNALGLIISIDGFTSAAIQEYSTRSSFITMDGADLMGVLSGLVRLEDVLRRKKRHVNETGECYFPVSQF